MAEDVAASGGIAAPSGASGASPTPSTSGSSTSAAPAVQGSEGPGSTDSTTADREAFIPRSRFDEVNGRMSAAEKQVADWKTQYGWAESVNRDQLAQMADWYGRYQGDPGEFLEKAYAEALSHPVHGATVKSRIGKMLASMRAALPTEIEPDIPVFNDQGQEVNRTYSASAMKQIVANAVKELVGKEVAPLQQDFQTRQQQAQHDKQQAFIAKEGTRITTAIQKYPGGKEHWPAILQASQEILKNDPEISVGEAARDAYMQVVYPTLTQSAQATVLSDFQKKANAQTVTQGTPTTAQRPTFKSAAEALAYFDAHPDEARAMAHR